MKTVMARQHSREKPAFPFETGRLMWPKGEEMASSIAHTLPDTHRSRCSRGPDAGSEGEKSWRLDGALVTQFLNGDNVAFGRILEAHHPRIRKYCYRVLRSTAKAEEATQEVFARALERLHTLRNAELLGVWLRSIALNLCLNMIEREKDYAGGMDIAKNVCSAEASPEQRLLAAERQLFIAELIAELPMQQGIVARMMYVDGYTYKEIEAATGLSNHQVKSYLQNARRRMKQAVSKNGVPALFDCNFRHVYSRDALINGGRHHD